MEKRCECHGRLREMKFLTPNGPCAHADDVYVSIIARSYNCGELCKRCVTTESCPDCRSQYRTTTVSTMNVTTAEALMRPPGDAI